MTDPLPTTEDDTTTASTDTTVDTVSSDTGKTPRAPHTDHLDTVSSADPVRDDERGRVILPAEAAPGASAPNRQVLIDGLGEDLDAMQAGLNEIMRRVLVLANDINDMRRRLLLLSPPMLPLEVGNPRHPASDHPNTNQ